MPDLLHAANSGATILYPESHLDLVRPGIALLRHRAGTRVSAPRWGCGRRFLAHRPSSFVKRLPAGEALSYGHRYRLERDANVATVPVGYADGYPRALSSAADVLIRGRRCRVAGNGHDGPADRGLRRPAGRVRRRGRAAGLAGRRDDHRGRARRPGRHDRVRDRDADRASVCRGRRRDELDATQDRDGRRGDGRRRRGRHRGRRRAQAPPASARRIRSERATRHAAARRTSGRSMPPTGHGSRSGPPVPRTRRRSCSCTGSAST